MKYLGIFVGSDSENSICVAKEHYTDDPEIILSHKEIWGNKNTWIFTCTEKQEIGSAELK